ncbi:MAG: oxidoreductase [Gammaproteobacteria bacterium]|nr:oxidoreductase [Gammaproteobacteria bacterium]
MTETVLVLGGGQAGAQAAASLRQEGFGGRILLIGAEPLLPYQRPPLSKAFLAGELPRERLLIKPEAFYRQADIEPMLGVAATALDVQARHLSLDDGRRLAFDRLLLATGGRPRPLDCPGADHSRLHYLRTVADVEHLRRHFHTGARLVIIGAGYIGLEVAAVAARHGLRVTVLEAAPRALARVTSPEVSGFFQRIHAEAGVEIRCNTGVARIDGSADLARVITGDGAGLDADLVLAGIGLLPNVELAQSAGIACDNGILVDELGNTSAAGILAAGDCANHPNAIYGCRFRLESVHNAIEQAKTAAATMAGKHKPYAQVPWFWSDQYDIKLQTAGMNRGYDSVVVRGDPATRYFAVFYLLGERLLAVDAINRPAEFIAARTLIPRRAAVDATRLADDAVPVKDLLA